MVMMFLRDTAWTSGWRRMGPWRSGRTYSRVCGAATAKGSEHVRVIRRQDPRWRESCGSFLGFLFDFRKLDAGLEPDFRHCLPQEILPLFCVGFGLMQMD